MKFGASAGETQGGQPPPEYTQRLENVLGSKNVASIADKGLWANLGQYASMIERGQFDGLPPEFANMRGGSAEENARNAQLLFTMLNQLGNGKAAERATESATPILESMIDGEQAVLHVVFDTKHTAIATSVDEQFDEQGRRIIQVMNPSDEVIQELIASGRFPSVMLTGHGDQGKIYTPGKDGIDSPRDQAWLQKNFGDPTKVKSILLDFCESDASTKLFQDMGIAAIGYGRDVDLDTAELARHVFAYATLMEDDMALDQSTMNGLAAGFDGVGTSGDNLRGSSKDGSEEADAGFQRGLDTVQEFLDKLLRGPDGVQLGDARENPDYTAQPPAEIAEPRFAADPVGSGVDPLEHIAGQYFGDTGIAPTMSSDEAMHQSMTFARGTGFTPGSRFQRRARPWQDGRNKFV